MKNQDTETYIFLREKKPEKKNKSDKFIALHWDDLYVANLVRS